jgi:hypothetical protein
VPTFADRGCHVVSVTNPYGRNVLKLCSTSTVISFVGKKKFLILSGLELRPLDRPACKDSRHTDCATATLISIVTATISFICSFMGKRSIPKQVLLKATVKFDKPNRNTTRKTLRIVLDLTFKVIEIKICVPVVLVFLCLYPSLPSFPLPRKKHACAGTEHKKAYGRILTTYWNGQFMC